MTEESILILNMLGEGKITAEQADSLLRAVRETAAPLPPPPPATPPAVSPDAATLAAMQNKLADLQGKFGELQGKIGAAQTVKAAGQAASFAGKVLDHIPRPDIDLSKINKTVDEAVRGLTSFKNDAVRTAKVAARQAGQEARRAARQGRKAMKMDFGLSANADTDAKRPYNSAEQPQVSETHESDEAWNGADAIAISNPYGHVKVVGEERETGSARFVTTRTVWAGVEAEARVLLQQVFLTTTVENGKFRARIVAPADAGARVTVDCEVRVPQHVPLEIETTHGDIEARGTSTRLTVRSEAGQITLEQPYVAEGGNTQAHSRSGNVHLRQWTALAANLLVETTSGDVLADGLQGVLEAALSSLSGDVTAQNLHAQSARLESASGDVSVSGGSITARAQIKTQSGQAAVTGLRADQLQIETVSGDARLKDTGGALTLKTVSGDLDAEGVQTPAVSLGTISGDARFAFAAPFSGSFAGTSVSGDLSVTLWTSSDTRVELSTTTGDVVCDLPLEEKNATGDKHLSGKIGGGLGSLRLQSVSGDLKITPSK